MKIVMIGAGNVATVLGMKLKASGHEIVQVYNRSIGAARTLASILEASYTDNWSELSPAAGLYIIALSDDAIRSLQPSTIIEDKAVVHTAGSVSMHVLAPMSRRYGVFYPLQTLRKEMPVTTEIPILVDGSDETLKKMLLETGSSISGKVIVASDEERLNLHLAAVFLNNFTNHLYALAESYCTKEGVSFDLLKPLILETAGRIMDHSPSVLRTGPAVRGDSKTIEKHLEKLKSQPALYDVYLQLTRSIQAVIS